MQNDLDMNGFHILNAGNINPVDADSISYTADGTGAETRTIAEKLNEVVSVKDFGAVGNGVTDDTVAIQAAIDSLGVTGGIVFFPPGRYIVSDTNADNSCLVIQYAIHLKGSGPFYTSIEPASGLSNSVNIITFNPTPYANLDFSSVEKLFIGETNTGVRTGNHGIYCNTSAVAQYLPKFTVKDCYIAQGSGYAIYHFNNVANNVNGGMWTALITNNILEGGIKLEGSGDSIVISNNILNGVGTGVDAALVAGASLLSILDNNITTSNSALIIRRGMRVNVLRNNIEHYVVGSNSNAVIDIIASSGTYVAGVIQQNLVAAFGATDATKLIHIRNARGTLIQDNTFLAGIGGITAIRVETTCNDVRIGANSYNAAIATKVNDLGSGTMGVVKTLSLLNSWVAQTSYDTPTVFKDLSGNVIISGCIKDGTTTYGTLLFNLPAGFRPAAGTVQRFNAYSQGGAGAEFGSFIVDEAGDVAIQDGGNVQFVLSGAIFNAENVANSASPE